MSYTNSNGLVDGNIPAGQPCPFYASCKMKTDRCPSETNLRERPFSCALARLNSLIKQSDDEGRPNNLLKSVRDNLGKP